MGQHALRAKGSGFKGEGPGWFRVWGLRVCRV